MAQLTQGQRLTLPITATQGYYFSTSGAAIVRVTPSNGGAFVVTIGNDEADVGWFGFDASLELIAQSGVLTYNTTPSALTAVQLGDQRDSDAVDVALNVNDLRVSFIRGRQSVVLFGDSYAEAQNFPIVDGNTTWFSLYRFILGQMGNSVEVVKNAGISGNRSDQMLARINTDVMPFKSDWVFFNCAVNDFFEGDRSVDAVTSDVAQILTMLVADGRKVLVFTCPPQVSTRSGFSVSKSTRVIQYNRWLVEYAATLKGVVVADIYSLLVNWNDTTNASALSDRFASDGIHLSTFGEIACVQAAVTALNGAIRSDLSLFNGPLDLGFIGTKALLVGTTGTNGVASSGQVATGYTSQRTSGTNGTIVASKIAARGQRQTITLVPTNGEIRLRLWSDILTDLTPHFGKTVTTKVLMRLRTTSGGVSLKDFSITLNNIAGGLTTEAKNGGYPTNVYAPITDTQFDTGVVLITLRDLLIPAGTTQAQLLIGLLLDSVAGGVVELDVYGVDVREAI